MTGAYNPIPLSSMHREQIDRDRHRSLPHETNRITSSLDPFHFSGKHESRSDEQGKAHGEPDFFSDNLAQTPAPSTPPRPKKPAQHNVTVLLL